jgi:hypothetical protein
MQIQCHVRYWDPRPSARAHFLSASSKDATQLYNRQQANNSYLCRQQHGNHSVGWQDPQQLSTMSTVAQPILNAMQEAELDPTQTRCNASRRD